MLTSEYLALSCQVKNCSRYKLAKDLGISQTIISKYNLGQATLSEKHAFIFSRILKIDASLIIAETKLENARNKDKQADIDFWQDKVCWILTSDIFDHSYTLPNGQVIQNNGKCLIAPETIEPLTLPSGKTISQEDIDYVISLYKEKAK